MLEGRAGEERYEVLEQAMSGIAHPAYFLIRSLRSDMPAIIDEALDGAEFKRLNTE